jgi:hypothetical protein
MIRASASASVSLSATNDLRSFRRILNILIMKPYTNQRRQQMVLSQNSGLAEPAGERELAYSASE